MKRFLAELPAAARRAKAVDDDRTVPPSVPNDASGMNRVLWIRFQKHDVSPLLRASERSIAMTADGPKGSAVLERSDKETAERFQELLKTWQRETALSSSTTQRAMHPAYQGIIGLGPRVIPLVLEELKRGPCDLFWALKAITGADPVSPEDRGRLDKMAGAWLAWGREKGVVT